MSIRLMDFLDLEYLQDIQDAFAKTFSLSAVVTLPDGVLLTRISGENPVCSAVRKVSPACACFAEKLSMEVARDIAPHHAYCDVCGFLNGMSPIIVNGRHLANWVIFHPTQGGEDLESKVRGVALEHNLGPDAMVQELAKMSRVPEQRFFAAMSHSESTVRSLSNLAYNNMLLQEETANSRRHAQLLRKTAKHQQLLNTIMHLLLQSQNLNRALGRSLSIIGETLELNGVYIFKNTPDARFAYITHDWQNGGLPAGFPPNILSYQNVPVLRRVANEQCEEESVEFSPDERLQFQAFWGNVTVFRQAVQVDDHNDGFIAFVDVDPERVWTQLECTTLANLSKILTHVLLRIQVETKVIDSMRLLETVLDNLNAWIYAIDSENMELLFINSRVRRDFGSDIIGKHCWEVIKKADAPCPGCPCLKSKAEADAEGATYSFEFYSEALGCWMLKNGAPMRWSDGRLAYLESDVDITETKQNEQLIEYMAWHDMLLELPNRDKCQHDLHACMEEYSWGSLLFLDLDDFKVINDAFGHSYGDQVLKAIASYFRASPEFSGKTYRFGGDEFVILLPGIPDQQVDALAEKLRARFCIPWLLDDHVSFCTASMGVARFPKDGDTVKELMRNIDIALYKAKSQGRNCIAHFSNIQNESIVVRLETEQRLRLSVLHGCQDFKIFYQPIIDIACGKWVGAEALVRWDDTGLGLVSPNHFISLAEYLGLIVPIGEHVLRTACAQCKRWQDMGVPDFYVNVNLSIRQLYIPNFISLIEDILQESELPPHCLTLEITETLAMQDMANVFKKLTDLRAMGIKVAMDDFGTGYSSLGTLRRIPLDILKIDRSFIQDITSVKYNRAFLYTIVELAQSLDLSVCSEGIETQEQLRIISNFGCHTAQGFLFSPPVPTGELSAKLRELYNLPLPAQADT